jgi:DNA (cytosine-5)-methyltransferase 1
MQKLKTLDLFAGIGGFSLGLERTGGFETAAFCEIDKKAQLVLRKHWPNVPIFEDVSELSKEKLDAEGINIDVITGGFPCQDISLAGKGAGLEGERSGLWFQFHRLIKEIQPRYALIENVSALRSRGLDTVLRGLSEIGYDAEWHCIPASAVGAPHRRDRIWITAYRNSDNQGQPTVSVNDEAPRMSGYGDVADATSIGSQGQGQPVEPIHPTPLVDGQAIESIYGRVAGLWTTEPDVGRVAHGVPNRVDRLKQLGNAVVPQIPQLLGHAILAREGIAS